MTAQAVGYPTLFLLVMLGAFLPVIPTGAIVSASAVVAWKQDPLLIFPVVVVSAAAALAGDLLLFTATSSGARWWRKSHPPAHEREDLRRRLEQHQVGVLVLSRLVPGGRIPVLLVAGRMGLTARRLLRGSAIACLAWASCYAAIGAFGGALFPEPWQGVLAAIVLVLLFLGVLRLVHREPESAP